MRSPSGIVLTALLAACQAVDPGMPPDEVTALPWTDAPADRLCWSARQAVERGEPARALLQLRTVLQQQPDNVDAQRLRQDVLRVRGRRGLLAVESAERLRRQPDDGHAHYLAARITPATDDKLDGFRRAAELRPDSMWPWFGLAHTLRTRESDRALRMYEQLYVASGRHPLIGIAYASALREVGRDEDAAGVYQVMRRDPRVPGVGDLGLAQVLLSGEDRSIAWGALLESLRHRPYDPLVQALLQTWFETSATADQHAQVLDVLREDGERWREFGRGSGGQTLVVLLLREALLHDARAVLETLLEERPTPDLRRQLRTVLLATGDVDGFVERLLVDVPRHVVDDERNQLRARWLALLDGPWRDGAALRDVDRALALLRALRDVGMLQEVEQVASLAVGRFESRRDEVQALLDEVREQLAFEAALRRMLYRGYRTGDTSDLGTVVGRIRELSQRLLGRDVVGEPATFVAPLVGEMLNPFGTGLCEHLARYNRHLVLGRRAGGTVEGLLTTRLCLRELPPQEQLELPARCFEVVGADRSIRPLGGVLGGDLAGVALLNHYLVDHDAVVDWAVGLRVRRRIAHEDGLALTRDPLPGDPGLDPFDAAWRLTLASPVPDEELDAAVLDMIRSHERRHLVDSFHYLPIEWNLWRGVGLFFSFGGSAGAIEAEMERRAELAALALSEHTELVLAHIADFYGDPPLQSPHHIGFSQLLAELRDELVELGVPADQALPSRWHLVSREQLRLAASRLLERLPGHRP